MSDLSAILCCWCIGTVLWCLAIWAFAQILPISTFTILISIFVCFLPSTIFTYAVAKRVTSDKLQDEKGAKD